MPKRGGRKKFSTPEEIEQQRKEMERLALGPTDESGQDGVQKGDDLSHLSPGATKGAEGAEESGEESSEDDEIRAKGVSHLIEVSNPNYVKTKSAMKLDQVDPTNSKRPVLSRREREEIEAQKLAEATEAALIKQEMETLALVRQEREREKAKAEAERKAKEAEKAKKAAEMQAKMQQKQLNKQNKGRKVNQQKLEQQKLEADKKSSGLTNGAASSSKAKTTEKEVTKTKVPSSAKIEQKVTSRNHKSTPTKSDWDDSESSSSETEKPKSSLQSSQNLKSEPSKANFDGNSDSDEVAFG